MTQGHWKEINRSGRIYTPGYYYQAHQPCPIDLKWNNSTTTGLNKFKFKTQKLWLAKTKCGLKCLGGQEIQW